ncbi:MAG: V-type ATP synthase subunit D [Spirochaetaceae bacterium]|jgi:V/A-type H+-transporting ATPase subunit D|nr:V-type ATP synthase subunit D [Spirochaetaceae bacterium]
MRKNVAPTKTNLLSLKSELKFARLGYELLDQKRNILVIELLNLVDQAVDYQDRVDKALADAFESLEAAALAVGKRKVLNISSAINIETKVNISKRKIMGVSLPVVDTSFVEFGPYYSPMGTSYWIDSSLQAFKAALELMGRLAELKISIIRLANEVRKTIRKVNALDKIAIPELKETVSFILNRLEENERDMLILMKMVKRRLENRDEKS